MGAGAGKVALQTTTHADRRARVPSSATADLVGYGARHLLRGSRADGRDLSNTTAALRKRGGCFDSDNNDRRLLDRQPGAAQLGDARFGAARRCRRRSTTFRAAGLTSPFAGQDVITSGVVTGSEVERLLPADAGCAARQRSGHVGGASSCSPSATPAVAVGNEVSARGTVSEFFDADADRELAAWRRHRDGAQRARADAGHADDRHPRPDRHTAAARAVRRHADARDVADVGGADRTTSAKSPRC